MKIGVLGGTFDPVHSGHIKMAEQASVSLGLSEIILVPAGQRLPLDGKARIGLISRK